MPLAYTHLLHLWYSSQYISNLSHPIIPFYTSFSFLHFSSILPLRLPCRVSVVWQGSRVNLNWPVATALNWPVATATCERQVATGERESLSTSCNSHSLQPARRRQQDLVVATTQHFHAPYKTASESPARCTLQRQLPPSDTLRQAPLHERVRQACRGACRNDKIASTPTSP